MNIETYAMVATWIFVAAIFNAIMDLSSENKFINPWWNKSYSWSRKWKHDQFGDVLYDAKGKEVERFWGSSRWFVFVTDGWHLCQFFMLRLLVLAIVWPMPINAINKVIAYVVASILWGAVFEGNYRIIKRIVAWRRKK
jgi:hypothetical protein